MNKNKTIILGLGNEYISDDGIGIHAIRELKKHISSDKYTIEELSVGGMELLDYISGYEKAIIVDAFFTGSNQFGTIYRYKQTTDEEAMKIRSSHQIDLPQIIGLAKVLGIAIPNEIIIYGVEAKDITTFKPNCTHEVESAIPRLVSLIHSELMENNRPISNIGLEIIN
jgi:hydrogenase maturation protease